MTGMITRSMPVFVVENRAHGNRAFATINEGLGKVLRFGANDASVLARLRWLASGVYVCCNECGEGYRFQFVMRRSDELATGSDR